jgi:hypothetical protein
MKWICLMKGREAMRTYPTPEELYSRADLEKLDSINYTTYPPLAPDEPLSEDDADQAASLKASPTILDQARAIYEGCDKTRLLVEALVLARVSHKEISAATGLSSEAIGAFESEYFDFRSRLDAPDFITFEAVQPCDYLRTVPQAYGRLFKRIAFARGPLMLERARPYLVDGRRLFQSLDTSTPEGRSRLICEVAIGAGLLPEHGRRKHSPVLSVCSFMQKLDSRQSARAVPMRELADNASLLLEDWSRDLIWEPTQQAAKERSPSEPEKTRQVAAG